MNAPLAGLPDGWELVRVDPRSGREAVGADDLARPRSVPVPAGKALIVVNDARRPTPTPWLLERLDVDWERDDLTVAVAAGSHDPPTVDELREIFGDFLPKLESRIVVNRAARDDFLHAGTTRRGTAVELNPCLAGASSVVCLGSVEPHYFAGWTGGRKSLVPGLCSLETMRLNHRLAVEGGAPGAPSRCPVHLDLEEATQLAGEWLGTGRRGLVGVNVVQHRGRFYDFFAGPLPGTVDALAPAATDVFARRLDTAFPVVVCRVDPPLDRDLYQALKAFEHWRPAVAPGGVLVIEAECAAGVGPPSFVQFLESSPPLGTLLEKAAARYSLGDHKLVSYLRYLEGGRSLFLVAGEAFPAAATQLPVFTDLARAVEAATRAAAGSGRKLLLAEDAGHLFPCF